MVSVLFVGDKEDGLDRLLTAWRSLGQGIEPRYATGAEDALALMEREPVDAVVASADLRGIGTTGLFGVTKTSHPSTTRIAVLPPGDKAAQQRSLAVANYTMPDNCEAHELTAVIKRASSVQRLLFDDATVRLVGNLGGLPSLPANLRALDDALSNEECSLAEAAAIIQSDVAMSSKILTIVNSSFFGLRGEISDLHNAVVFLGVEVLRDFALTSAAFRAFAPSPMLPVDWLAKFNEHAKAVADIAGRLVHTSYASAEASVVGMLHGVGELVLAERSPADLAAVNGRVAAGEDPSEVELSVLGTTLPRISGYLLATWGMNYRLVEAITTYRDHRASQDREPDLVDVLHAADALAERRLDTNPDPASTERSWICQAARHIDVSQDYLAKAGLLGLARSQGFLG